MNQTSTAFIKFHTIEYKNILSVGNMPIKVSLDKSPTTAILGENGQGKSTFIEAISFCLFGKPFRKINKHQLINNRNGKGLLTICNFTRGTDDVEITRGLKPNIFEIKINGVTVNQDSKNTDYQTYFEKDILGLDFNSFTQIVMIGKSTYIPFMELPAGMKRTFVESILDLDVFSLMSVIHKRDVDETQKQILESKSDIKLYGEKVKSQEKLLDQITKSIEQNANDKREIINNLLKQEQINLNNLEHQIETLRNELKEIDIQSIKNDIVDSKARITKIESLKTVIDININSVTSELDFFNKNDSCITCGRVIEESFRSEAIVLRNKKLKSFVKSKDELDDKLNVSKKSLLESQKSYRECEEKLKHLDRKLSELSGITAKINQLSTDLINVKTDSTDINKSKEMLETMRDNLRVSFAKYEASLEEDKYNALITSLLKDSGIKLTIVNKYIPIINKIINSNIKQLGIFANFALDEQFKETIQVRGFEPVVYHQMSEGEKLRFDMAVMMAWRDIARLKSNMSTNLLIMDEVFDASMDQVGVDAFVDMLNTFNDMNVFVITHTPEKIADTFKSFISFTKVNGFTVIYSTENC